MCKAWSCSKVIGNYSVQIVKSCKKKIKMNDNMNQKTQSIFD